jgi:hypothetical protein
MTGLATCCCWRMMKRGEAILQAQCADDATSPFVILALTPAADLSCTAVAGGVVANSVATFACALRLDLLSQLVLVDSLCWQRCRHTAMIMAVSCACSHKDAIRGRHCAPLDLGESVADIVEQAQATAASVIEAACPEGALLQEGMPDALLQLQQLASTELEEPFMVCLPAFSLHGRVAYFFFLGNQPAVCWLSFPANQ